MDRIIRAPGGSCYLDGPALYTSNKYLSSSDFPNTNGLYACHNDGSSAFSGTNWTGGVDFVQIGSLGSGLNHLGQTVYCVGDGNDGLYLPAASIPAGANKSFSAGCWMKINSISVDRNIVSRYSSTGSEQSFIFAVDTNGDLFFNVYYSSGAANYLGGPRITSLINDGLFHKFECSYKYVSSTESYTLIMLDGYIVGYQKITSNAGRNDDGGANVTFGGRDATGDLNGSISECWFKQEGGSDAHMEPNEMRKIYAAGCGHLVTIGNNGKVVIQDGRKNNGNYLRYISSSKTVTATTWGTKVDEYAIYLPEDGNYNLILYIQLYAGDGTTTPNYCDASARLVGGNTGNIYINGTICRVRRDVTLSAGSISASDIIFSCYCSVQYLGKKNELIQLEAIKDFGTDTCSINYDGVHPNRIGWEKLD